MRDPTAELLVAMASVGLRPKQIQWDGNFHRFPGIGRDKGDAGWLTAFVDQRGAVFGDWRTKQQWQWPGGNQVWRESMRGFEPLSAEEVAEKKAATDEQRAKDAAKATKAIRSLWSRAKACTAHPYLETKEIVGARFLRWVPDLKTGEPILLIPMFNADGELMSLQRIWPDGTRKQMWQPGGSVGLYNTIGADRYKTTKILYVCEGWATGWSIHLATECAVIVAFFDGGLKTVGKIIKAKYPDARIVMCADNDRWSPVPRDGKNVNPGVYAAREAAKELGADLAIPDFKSLEGEPTDFDDLRQLEGLDAVRKWLDPKMAGQAVTEAWDTGEAKEAAEREPPLQPEWQPEAHDVLPAVSDNPLDTLMPEMSALAKVVGEDGWTPEHVETLANIRFAARELDVDGPPPPTVDGMSSPEALAALEAHAKAYAPRPDDALFEADGSPRGLLMGDDWRKKVPPVSWAVEKWALAGTVVFLAGRGATGKTPLSIQLALAVASGRSEVIPVAHDDSEAPQLTRDVKPRTAVVIGWESTDEDMMRIRAAIEKCGGPSTADVGDRFKFLPAGQRGIGPIWAPGKDGSGHVATRARPTDNGEKIMDWLRSLDDLGLVVFDPVASCFAADENSRALVREFLDWLAAFAANHPGRPLVLIVGHPAKATAGESADYSGTTDWRNACRAMWLLRRQAATGYKKAEADETKHYMCLTLNKLNAPGRQPISVPLASSRAAGLGWRWKEAPTVRDAVASYAEVLGLTPAQRERAADEHRPPSKTKKAQRYVSDRIVDQLKGSPSLPLAAVQSDYEAWHLDTYDAKSEGLLGKRAFNDAMKEDGRAPRIGQSKGVEYLNNASFADAENNQ